MNEIIEILTNYLFPVLLGIVFLALIVPILLQIFNKDTEGNTTDHISKLFMITFGFLPIVFFFKWSTSDNFINDLIQIRSFIVVNNVFSKTNILFVFICLLIIVFIMNQLKRFFN